MTLTEQVFRKMGLVDIHKTDSGYYLKFDGSVIGKAFARRESIPTTHSKLLPPIDSQWEVCAKYLVPFMREKGWEIHIEMLDASFLWERIENKETDFEHASIWQGEPVEIKDDNIALAACQAFMEVEL